MKRITLCFFIMIFLFGCSSQTELKVKVTNNLSIKRTNETVEIALSDVIKVMGKINSKSLVIFNSSNEEIPSQLIYCGGEVPLKIIFQATVDANSSADYIIKSGKPGEYPLRTYGRFVPERYDDYIWENDRIAFRIYGLALIPKDGPSNGLDVWVKRTDKMIINKWIHDYNAGISSYHDDNGEGCDSYKVGRTLGAGGMAPFMKDSMWLGINFQSYQTLDNGPIRTSFKVFYPPFYVDKAKITETKTISLDAGYQLNAIIEEYQGCDSVMTVAAGIVKRKEGKELICSVDKGYITYCLDEGEGGITYLGVVNTIKTDSIQEINKHLAITSKYSKCSKLLYYAGAGWSKWGFETEDRWNAYIEEFTNRLKNPLVVKLY